MKERREGSKVLEVIAKRRRTPLGTSEPSLAAAPCSKCWVPASEGRKHGVPLLRSRDSEDRGRERGRGSRRRGGGLILCFNSEPHPERARERAAEGTVLTRARW